MPSKSQSFFIEKMRKPIKKKKTPVGVPPPSGREAIACRGASVSKKHTAPNFFRSGAFLLD